MSDEAPDAMNSVYQHAAEVIGEAEGIFLTAGAGMGVDSGLPDFRGDAGFWRAYPLLESEGLGFQDLANPQWFESDPERAWGFYGHRYALYKVTQPHAGYGILRQWVEGREHFVFTSNVDGHFQRAGFDSVYECHGSIRHLQCVRACTEAIWPMDELGFEVCEERLRADGDLPRCPHCGGLARPNILMFGDYHWLHQRSEGQYDQLEDWRWKMRGKKVVTIEMGAGTAIPTVRLASEKMPGTTVRINPREADGGSEVLSVASGAYEALQRINTLFEGA
ncbi:SIR2 family NAD-dependent protein deacylase [Rubritalea tangerina]|uniref:protein acetyllysine N-acetyltransferase n=1 Tax=Rubritalea tangerina TaxID=430798 RepID=A0ABW4Z6S0_9BACT